MQSSQRLGSSSQWLSSTNSNQQTTHPRSACPPPLKVSRGPAASWSRAGSLTGPLHLRVGEGKLFGEGKLYGDTGPGPFSRRPWHDWQDRAGAGARPDSQIPPSRPIPKPLLGPFVRRPPSRPIQKRRQALVRAWQESSCCGLFAYVGNRNLKFVTAGHGPSIAKEVPCNVRLFFFPTIAIEFLSIEPMHNPCTRSLSLCSLAFLHIQYIFSFVPRPARSGPTPRTTGDGWGPSL